MIALGERHREIAALERHIAYERELLAGDEISIRSRLLEMRERMVRIPHEMFNDGGGEVVATTEKFAARGHHRAPGLHTQPQDLGRPVVAALKCVSRRVTRLRRTVCLRTTPAGTPSIAERPE